MTYVQQTNPMKSESNQLDSTQTASPYERQVSINDNIQPLLEPAKEVPPIDNTPDQFADRGYRTSQFAQQINQLKPQQKSIHCQALLASMFLVGGVTTALILFFQPDPQISVEAMVGICAGAYFLYLLIGCCCNKLSSYLDNIDKGQCFQSYYDSIRNKVGQFRFDAECYHYETRYHTRTYTDSDGNTQTETYTTEEKVVTHRATQYLHPAKMVDQSGVIDQIRALTAVVFIRFAVHYKFADSFSQDKFNSFFQNFKKRHTFDTYQTFGYKYEIPGMIERKAFYVGELECNFGGWYYLCGFLCLLWPYSLWVESKISRFVVDYLKILTI